MDFDFTDDQEMLRDTVRRWVERGYDFERRRGIVKAGGFARDDGVVVITAPAPAC